MRVNAASLDIRDATTSTPGTLNDLTTDLIMANNNNRGNKRAKIYSSMMPAIIAKSCNIILIGKTYWKSAALPAILHGTEAIYLSNTYLANLQKEENKVLRYIVNARRKTAISALRGEFGISLQSTSDMKS